MSEEAKEIWESTVPGRVSVTVENKAGRPERLSTIGKGSRLRIMKAQREIVQEGIRHKQNDPFTNGMLLHVNRPEGAAADRSPDELSDDDLRSLFELEGGDFEEAFAATTEINQRRMRTMITADLGEKPEVDASLSQSTFVNTYIDEHYKVEGDTPTYRQMQADPTGV